MEPPANSDIAPTPRDPANSEGPSDTAEQGHLRLLIDPAVVEALSLWARHVATPKTSSFAKEYLPILTPLAAMLVSLVVSYYTVQFSQRAAVSASSESLTKLIDQFKDIAATPLPAKPSDPGILAAMKLAVYGDQALPAVKLALSAENNAIRRGGVLVAAQMYRAETVNRHRLSTTMASYYDDSALRLGVSEWFVEMGRQLSPKDGVLALKAISKTFGNAAERCADQDEELAMTAAQYVSEWSSRECIPLALGMLKNCSDRRNPTRFDRVRRQAVNALPPRSRLDESERIDLNNSLTVLRDSVTADLRSEIEAAIGRMAQSR